MEKERDIACLAKKLSLHAKTITYIYANPTRYPFPKKKKDRLLTLNEDHRCKRKTLAGSQKTTFLAVLLLLSHERDGGIHSIVLSLVAC